MLSFIFSILASEAVSHSTMITMCHMSSEKIRYENWNGLETWLKTDRKRQIERHSDFELIILHSWMPHGVYTMYNMNTLTVNVI